MTTLNSTSRKAQGYLWALNRAIEKGCDDLHKAYKNPSYSKELAYERIQRRKDALLNYETLYVIGHNCSFFTTAYFDENDVIVDTYCNTYIIINGRDYL